MFHGKKINIQVSHKIISIENQCFDYNSVQYLMWYPLDLKNKMKPVNVCVAERVCEKRFYSLKNNIILLLQQSKSRN